MVKRGSLKLTVLTGASWPPSKAPAGGAEGAEGEDAGRAQGGAASGPMLRGSRSAEAEGLGEGRTASESGVARARRGQQQDLWDRKSGKLGRSLSSPVNSCCAPGHRHRTLLEVYQQDPEPAVGASEVERDLALWSLVRARRSKERTLARANSPDIILEEPSPLEEESESSARAEGADAGPRTGHGSNGGARAGADSATTRCWDDPEGDHVITPPSTSAAPDLCSMLTFLLRTLNSSLSLSGSPPRAVGGSEPPRGTWACIPDPRWQTHGAQGMVLGCH